MQSKSGYNNTWLYFLTAEVVYLTLSITDLGSEIICFAFDDIYECSASACISEMLFLEDTSFG